MLKFVTTFYVIICLMAFLAPLSAQETICGYAAESNAQAPLPNVTVYLHDQYNLALDEDLRTKTDASGYYEFNNIPPDKYSVKAWTWVEFRDEQYAFVFQPGDIRVESDTSSRLPLPCHYVNFELNLHIEEELFEKYKDNYIQALRSFAEQANLNPNSLNPNPWRMQNSALVMSVKAKVSSTIDSLYHHAPSFYFRRPGDVN